MIHDVFDITKKQRDERKKDGEEREGVKLRENGRWGWSQMIRMEEGINQCQGSDS